MATAKNLSVSVLKIVLDTHIYKCKRWLLVFVSTLCWQGILSGAWQLHIYNTASQKLKQLIFVHSGLLLIVIIVI